MQKHIIVAIVVVALAILTFHFLPFPDAEQFNLIDPEKTAILRPVVYYNLPNGSVIEVKDKNPFPFTIELVENVKNLKVPETIEVYSYEVYQKPDEVFRMAKSFGVSADKLYYNKVTKAYLYNDDKLNFEYYASTGYFRVIFKTPREATTFLKSSGLLDYEYKEIKKEHGTFFARTFNGFSSNIGVFVKFDKAGVRSVEGLLLKDVQPKGRYKVLPVVDIPEKLAERVKGDVKADDWYLSNIAFTKLTITNVSLVYTITPDGILPVYRLHGKYAVEYDGIKDSGEVDGRIVAVLP
ncbi:hypothetical protein [Archaeoglobus neptunius]|uniref:hypothetical protein n=1 Tax=Archaeoglobus neptunius TaxID=2798580 RepID=UPI0019252ACC|nr:hypothetical protein [Archaeoglobus neptunius]